MLRGGGFLLPAAMTGIIVIVLAFYPIRKYFPAIAEMAEEHRQSNTITDTQSIEGE